MATNYSWNNYIGAWSENVMWVDRTNHYGVNEKAAVKEWDNEENE